MTRSAIAFSTISLLPIPLLLCGAWVGGIWPWLALIYLTVLAFALDEMSEWVRGATRQTGEFPAADQLTVLLALGHFVVLAIAVPAIADWRSWAEAVPLFLATGLFFGQVSNSNAHELIHRSRRGLFTLGKWVFISLLFGHHTSAHRLVHHVRVASPDDPNSARIGESYYRFAVRAWSGSFWQGLRAERQRLRGRSRWHNPYVVYFAGAFLCMVLALWTGAFGGLLVYVMLCVYAQAQLLVSDYVQHYGLSRVTQENGQLAPVGPEHSWNAPHWFTAHLMLNAPRHSDHHMRPTKKFAELALPSDEAAPHLPRSLPVMSVLALWPGLWRKVMDPRARQWVRKSRDALAA